MILTKKNGEKFTVLYDDEDEELVSKYTWCIEKNGYCRGNLLGSRESSKTKTSFHRLVMNLNDRNLTIDHINHNKLDNRKENLRIATMSQNARNRKASSNGNSKYLGVSYKTYTRKNKNGTTKTYTSIRAGIRINKVPICIGYFKTEEEAGRAYDKMAKLHHGEFANLNFPNE